MSNIIFIFTPTKLKSKINFVALRINKKINFYSDKLSIETKKYQLHTHDHIRHKSGICLKTLFTISVIFPIRNKLAAVISRKAVVCGYSVLVPVL
jgi:hypothetical protein